MFNKPAPSQELRKSAKNKKAYETIFKTPSGNVVLKDLFNNAFINMGQYYKDNNEITFMEGKRAIVIHILSMIRMPFDQYLSMYMKGEDDEFNEL